MNALAKVEELYERLSKEIKKRQELELKLALIQNILESGMSNSLKVDYINKEINNERV